MYGVIRGRAFILGLFLLGLLVFLPSAYAQQAQCDTAGAQALLQSNDSDRLYKAAKSVEGCFVVPTPQATVPFLTLDAAGKATYGPTVTNVVVVPKPASTAPTSGGQGTGPATKPPSAGASNANVVDSAPNVTATVPVNAVNVILTFQRTNTAGQWSARIMAMAGGTVPAAMSTVAAGQATLQVNVAKASEVLVTFGSNTSQTIYDITIARPPVIGAGAFTIPVIPMNIVYAAPQDPNGKSNNSNSYQLTTTLSTSITSSFSDDNNTKSPVTIGYVNPMDVYSSAASLLKNLPGPLGQAFGYLSTALTTIQKLVGSASQTLTQGTTVSTTHTLTVSDNQVDKDVTGTTLGPGLDDIFVYLSNVRMMWLAQNGTVQLTIIGFDRSRTSGAHLLAEKDKPGPLDCVQQPDGHTVHCIKSADVKLLLSLDPFTAPLINTPYTAGQKIPVPPTDLVAPRFSSCTTYNESGGTGSWQPSDTHSVTTQDQVANTTYTQIIDDEKAGWLGFASSSLFLAGLVPSTQTVTNKVTNTVTTGLSVGTSVTIGSTFNLQGDDFAVEQCYDSVYGTYAYASLSTTPAPTVSGTATDPSGRPLSSQTVILEIGANRYITRTDAQGHFALNIAGLSAGPATLVNGKSRQSIQLVAGKLPIQVLRRP